MDGPKSLVLVHRPGVLLIDVLVAGLALCLLLLRSGPPARPAPHVHPPGAQAAAIPASNPRPSAITVELSSRQVTAIQIAPVGTHRFRVETEAAGAISFAEDPAVIQAESALLAAAAAAQVNSNELARARSLFGTNGVAQRELEQAGSDEQTAAAALQAARMALRALGKSEAEMDALIAAGALNPEAPGPGMHWLLAEVLESDSPRIHSGQPASVCVPALPGRTFAARVARVSATIDPNLHRLPIRCAVADPHDELRPGMLAQATLQVAPPVESPAIPPNGVVREGDGSLTAWVTADRRHFTQKSIRIGLREDDKVQVLAGLAPGELVVADGALFLDNLVNAGPDD